MLHGPESLEVDGMESGRRVESSGPWLLAARETPFTQLHLYSWCFSSTIILRFSKLLGGTPSGAAILQLAQ